MFFTRTSGSKAPPLTTADLWLVVRQNANFFSGSLRSRFILEIHILWQTCSKEIAYAILSTMWYCIIFNTRGPNIEMLPTPLVHWQLKCVHWQVFGTLLYGVGIVHELLLEEHGGRMSATAWAGSLYAALVSLGGRLACGIHACK